jgi:hypothetical protein
MSAMQIDVAMNIGIRMVPSYDLVMPIRQADAGWKRLSPDGSISAAQSVQELSFVMRCGRWVRRNVPALATNTVDWQGRFLEQPGNPSAKLLQGHCW